MKLWAYDHLCLLDWPVPLPTTDDRSFIYQSAQFLIAQHQAKVLQAIGVPDCRLLGFW